MVTTLAGGAEEPSEAPGITASGDNTTDPSASSEPTETPDDTDDTGDDYEFVEQTDIPLGIGESATVEGRAGNPVGTFQVDSVTPAFTACTAPDYVPLETTQYVEIMFTATAEDELAAEDDSWDYPQEFQLFLADVTGPNDEYLRNDLGFECVKNAEWIEDVAPGETLTGPIYLEVEGLVDGTGVVEWDYGHQAFKIPFP